MQRVIYKYPLDIEDEQAILMHRGAQILDVQFQGDQLVLWAVVEPERILKQRIIKIFGTGQPLHGNIGSYISTVQDHVTGLVWHVFIVDDIYYLGDL